MKSRSFILVRSLFIIIAVTFAISSQAYCCLIDYIHTETVCNKTGQIANDLHINLIQIRIIQPKNLC